MAQSGYGKILMFEDFGGGEFPVANAVAYGTSPTHAYLGDFKITGKFAPTDAGIVGLAKAGGWGRLTGTNEADEGIAVGTEVCFSPALNGPLGIEARVETQVLTARNLWLGFADVNADANVPPVTGATTTLTLVASDLCGFVFDSTLTAAADWHMTHNGGTTTGATDSTTVVAGSDTLIASTSVVLRLEIDTNGTARWYIDGVLRQTVVNALDPTVLLSGTVACYGTTTTITDIDVDYLAVEANRDWTV